MCVCVRHRKKKPVWKEDKLDDIKWLKSYETVLLDVGCPCYPQSSATTTTTSIKWIFVASRHQAEARHLQSGWWLKFVFQSAVIEGHRGRHVAKGHCAHQLATASRHDGVQSKDQMSGCCPGWTLLWFSKCQNCSAKRRGGVHHTAQQHSNNLRVFSYTGETFISFHPLVWVSLIKNSQTTST